MSKLDIELGKLIMQVMYGSDETTDCGNPRRWEFDDGGRSAAEKGVGMCDYSCGCDWFRAGKCPFQKKKEEDE